MVKRRKENTMKKRNGKGFKENGMEDRLTSSRPVTIFPK